MKSGAQQFFGSESTVLLPFHNLWAVAFGGDIIGIDQAVRVTVQVAEDVASLDVMSDGRVVFGVGLGYRAAEYEAFGVARRDGVPRMLEALDLVKRLWTEDGVTHEGRFFQLHGATCTIRPVQKPFPPIWMAANADAAVARAARLGYPWYANPHAPLATIERQWRLYKDVSAQAGHALPTERPIALECHVAPTREEAFDIARPFLAPKYTAYAEWGQDKVLPGDESFRIGFETLAQDRFLLGTADDVIAGLEERVKRLESTYIVLRVSWPGMAHAAVMQVLERLGEGVLPHFRRKR